MAIILEDIVDIVGVTILVNCAIVLYIVISRTEVKESLGGKKGWYLLMIACLLFGIRALGHFIEMDWFQIIRRSFGILGAVIYPLGLYTMYKAIKSKQGVTAK